MVEVSVEWFGTGKGGGIEGRKSDSQSLSCDSQSGVSSFPEIWCLVFPRDMVSSLSRRYGV